MSCVGRQVLDGSGVWQACKGQRHDLFVACAPGAALLIADAPAADAADGGVDRAVL